jgi:hypothetical protein
MKLDKQDDEPQPAISRLWFIFLTSHRLLRRVTAERPNPRPSIILEKVRFQMKRINGLTPAERLVRYALEQVVSVDLVLHLFE